MSLPRRGDDRTLMVFGGNPAAEREPQPATISIAVAGPLGAPGTVRQAIRGRSRSLVCASRSHAC